MTLIWACFIVFVLLMLAMDLGLFHRTAHEVKIREAMIWSCVWVVVSILFSVFVYYGYENQWLGMGTVPDAIGHEVNNGKLAVVKYLTGYVLEKSLSVDNIFVIAMLFKFFAVPARLQHRVLFWGILGALILRGAMIGLGVGLIARFHWILYVFGLILLASAVKMFRSSEGSPDPNANFIVRWVRRHFPVTDRYEGDNFAVRTGPRKRWALTPLAIALVVVESSDVVFAVDSIPAIFAVTADPFLVFTSNVFAILGLRSLYFALAGLMGRFRYLNHSLAIILAIVGVKMLLGDRVRMLFGENTNFVLLALVFLILLGGIAASMAVTRKKRPLPAAAPRRK